MAKGIRSYGPGKFNTILESYVHEMTLDGGADEEASYGEGGGWYGLVWLDEDAHERISEIAEENKDSLTKEEEDLLDDSLAVILFEQSDGIVEADWFSDKKEADARWTEIEDDTAGDEDNEEEEDDDDN